MKLPENAVIAVSTLHDELLEPKAPGNQAAYLAQGDYTLKNWSELERDLRDLLEREATRVRSDDSGDYYEINGKLGELPVKTLWFWAKESEAPQFKTLLPFV